MLFCVGSPLRGRRHHRPTQRRATVQLRLTFLDPPAPEARVWEALEHEQRATVIDVLARLLVKTILVQPLEEPDDE